MHQAGSDAYGTVMVYIKAGMGCNENKGKIFELDD